MKDIVIVGYGGFAREVEWLISRINEGDKTWNFKGFIDVDTSKDNVIGDDEYVLRYDKELYVALAIGEPRIREILYKKYKENPNIRFANLMDPSVISSKRITLGEGNIVCAGTIITVDIEIGNCNIINLDCTIGHDVVIEDYVTLNPSVNVSGNCVIGCGSNIGTGTQVIQGKKIGKRVTIGAGAVVRENIIDNCTAVGVPAKIIKKNND